MDGSLPYAGLVRARVVMLDAGFEAVLGTVLVMGYVFGQIDDDDFPVSGVVTAVAGLLLIGLAVGLMELVKREALDDRLIGLLAASNAVSALLLAAWVLLASGFSPTGRAVVWVTVGMLLLLAATQASVRGTGRPEPPSELEGSGR